MATATLPDEEVVDIPAEQRFLLRDIDWGTYRAISNALHGRHFRLTYDRGNLELMTISRTHGGCSRLLVLLVFVLAEEFELTISNCGDMTCDREDLDRGVEPDESFYLANEPLVRGKAEIDLTVDPPPDLVGEIDISRSSRNRLSIYAAMQVPEVWRYDGNALQVLHLMNGQYQPSDRSRSFPGLPILELATFLNRRAEMDEIALVRSFREWVRGQIGQKG